MVKAEPPSAIITFKGRRDYRPEADIDDWGLTPAQQESYVELFRRHLVQKGLYKEEDHDYYTLRRFLRARSYNMELALNMFLEHLKWREENKVDTILTDFVLEERNELLKAYPQGYHKFDKMGRPVYIQLIGKIDVPTIMKCTTEERLFKFHVQEYERCVRVIMPICSRLASKNVDQTFGIMDVKGVGMGHLTGDVKKMLTKFTKTDQDNYPEMLGHICIINAPLVFRAVWSIVKNMIDVRTQSKIEILGPNYMPALLKWVDADSIPKLIGGNSEGTLLDDVGPWSDRALLAEHNIDVDALRRGRPRPPGSVASVRLNSFSRLSSNRPEDMLAALPAAAGAMGLGSGTMQRAASQRTASADGSEPAVSANGGSPTAAAAASLTAIPETRTRTLIERVAAIEGLLSKLPDSGRVRAAREARGDTVSTRSAPEGSLLNRVEVLEEALETLLIAQEALIQEAAQQDAAAEEVLEHQVQQQTAHMQQSRRHASQHQPASTARQGCCTIM